MRALDSRDDGWKRTSELLCLPLGTGFEPDALIERQRRETRRQPESGAASREPEEQCGDPDESEDERAEGQT